MNALEESGLSIEFLKSLSYKSNLGKSLKKNLHYFDKEDLLNELSDMIDWLDSKDFSKILIDYRIKSLDSIELKYERHYPDAQVRKVFNDILGFRTCCDNYDDILSLESLNFKIVDMSKGKANDDGYRGVHLYFQLDNSHYPIEVQYNTYYDRQFNNWLHKYLYKKKVCNSVGKKLRFEYESGKIIKEEDFKEVLRCVM